MVAANGILPDHRSDLAHRLDFSGREVRRRILSTKNDDIVFAAKLDRASELRVNLRHFAPSFISPIIATLTLAVPAMILAETALSFLGMGLRAPIVSWGVPLQDAKNVRAAAAPYSA